MFINETHIREQLINLKIILKSKMILNNFYLLKILMSVPLEKFVPQTPTAATRQVRSIANANRALL